MLHTSGSASLSGMFGLISPQTITDNRSLIQLTDQPYQTHMFGLDGGCCDNQQMYGVGKMAAGYCSGVHVQVEIEFAVHELFLCL